MLVYLNGEVVPLEQARIGVRDRGFLFGDGVYEVIRSYHGRFFRLPQHIQRLADGLAALRIPFDRLDEVATVAERLLDENGFRDDGDATVYIQVTRGEAPRTHAFPDNAVPTVFMQASRFNKQPDSFFENGVAAITVPDQRWARCDIKSVALLPNVLAKQQAKEAGAIEALLVRDGMVMEGSHSNFFAVFDGTLHTYPASNYILAGITRAVVLELAAELGIPTRETPVPLARLGGADELFITGTTTEVMPLNSVDGQRVGEGRAGPVTRRLQQAFEGWT